MVVEPSDGLGQDRRPVGADRHVDLAGVVVHVAAAGSEPQHGARRVRRAAAVRHAQRQHLAADAGLQLVRGALGDHPAAVDHGDRVCQAVGLIQVLRREQQGGSLGHQLADDVPHLQSAARVQARRRLVEEQNLRAPDETGTQVQSPAHAAGVRLGHAVGRVRQLEALEDLLAASLRLGGGHVVQTPHHLEVLQARQVLVHRGVLSREADHVPELLRLTDHVEAGDGRSARIGMQQRGQDPDGGRLPRAVGSEEPEDRSGRDTEVDARERLDLAVPLRQALRRRSRDRSWNRPSYQRRVNRSAEGRGDALLPALELAERGPVQTQAPVADVLVRARQQLELGRAARNGVGYDRRELGRRLPRLPDDPELSECRAAFRRTNVERRPRAARVGAAIAKGRPPRPGAATPSGCRRRAARVRRPKVGGSAGSRARRRTRWPRRRGTRASVARSTRSPAPCRAEPSARGTFTQALEELADAVGVDAQPVDQPEDRPRGLREHPREERGDGVGRGGQPHPDPVEDAALDAQHDRPDHRGHERAGREERAPDPRRANLFVELAGAARGPHRARPARERRHEEQRDEQQERRSPLRRRVRPRSSPRGRAPGRTTRPRRGSACASPAGRA